MIYVIAGTDVKLVTTAAKKHRKEEFPDPKAMNFASLDMAEARLIDLYNECVFHPLGFERKCVVADNCSFLSSARLKLTKKDDETPFLEYCAKPDPDCDLYLLVYTESKKLDKKNKFLKAIEAGGGKLEEIVSFTPQKWKAYIPAFFNKRGQNITDGAVSELISRSCGDYNQFYNDACKLSTYAGSETINEKMVRELVATPIEERAYVLTSALLSGDEEKATSVYRDLLSSGQKEFVIINILGKEFIKYHRVKSLNDQGYSADEIASSTGMRSNQVFGVLKSLRGVPPTADFPRQVEKLYQLQKNILLGKVERNSGLALYIANFSL